MSEPLRFPPGHPMYTHPFNRHLRRFNEWLDSKPAPDAAHTRRAALPDWVQARCFEAFTAGYHHQDHFDAAALFVAETRRAQRRAFFLGWVSACATAVTVGVIAGAVKVFTL